MRRSNGGFTLVEMIVVTIILGVLSGAIVLRFTDQTRRRADLVIAKVSAILETLAHRQEVGQDPIRLVYDDEARVLWLERLMPEVDEDGKPTGWSEWESDPAAPEAMFTDEVRLEAVRFDGTELGGFVEEEIALDEVRPVIEVAIGYGERAVIVELLPNDLKATRYDGEFSDRARPAAKDLDAAGEGETKW